jgi:hypothetical protein
MDALPTNPAAAETSKRRRERETSSLVAIFKLPLDGSSSLASKLGADRANSCRAPVTMK